MSDSATRTRTPRGSWALNYYGDEVVLVHPGGRLAGPPAQVAAGLDRLTAGPGLGELDRRAVRIIRWLLSGGGGRPAGRRARTWSNPAVGYWISGPYNDPDRLGYRSTKTTSSGSAWKRTESLA